MEIDKLTNCPNCDGILDESGRCKFCGSKIYDFLTLNFRDPYSSSEKTYIRLMANGKVHLIPVYAVDASITMDDEPVYLTCYNGTYCYANTRPDMTINVTFRAYETYSFEEKIMSNDTVFLTCPKCHKTKAFSYYYEICYVCDCGYLYEGDVLTLLKCNSLRYIPTNEEGDEK